METDGYTPTTQMMYAQGGNGYKNKGGDPLGLNPANYANIEDEV